METVEISLTEFNIGDILAADIYNQSGILLVNKDTIINSFIKNKLTETGITTVRIYNPSAEVNYSYTEFKTSYSESILQVKGILNDLASGKRIDYERVLPLSGQIYSNIKENYNIAKFLQKIHSIDEYTYTHSLNTAYYSMLIGKWLNFPEREIKMVIQSGLLHDIGKLKIPAEILNKKGILTRDEYEIIKKHTIYGYGMLNDLDDIDPEIKHAVLLHHERIDGSGYPLNAGPDLINMYAHIVAVADVFDAMTSDRAYKKQVTPFEAFEMFVTVGVGIFDTHVLNVFLKNIPNYYVDCNVILNNGSNGRIVYVSPQDIVNPIVAVDSEYIDLARNTNLKIVGIV